jgi:YVTN family beta-propeller protein
MLACLLCAECGAGASCSVNTAPLVVGVQTDVPGQPFGIAVTPDSGWLLATMDGVGTGIAVVRVTSTGLQPLRTLLLPEAAAPTGVGLTNSGNVLMVAEYGAGALLLVSVPLLEAGHGHPVLDQIKTGFGAIEAVATPGGGYAFVSNERNASISVVDLRTRQLVGNIPVPSTPVGLALSPNGEYLYGTSEQGFLSVINVRTAGPTRRPRSWGWLRPGTSRCGSPLPRTGRPFG